MASRKEQKERLRKEREERERAAKAAERRRRLIGYGAGGVLVLAAVAVIAVLLLGGGDEGGGGGGKKGASNLLPSGGKAPEQKVTDLKAASDAAGCDVERVKSSGRDHTETLDELVKYNSNPPTSGNHFITPADDGAYGEAPQDEELVHSLEHGRVIVWFKPSLPEEARADLRAFFDEDGYQMVMVPRAKMPYAVAATAWSGAPQPLGRGNLLGCKRYDAKIFDALRAFRDEHRGRGPEPVP